MSPFAAPFADANRLFRSGLVLVDELPRPSPVRPVETMARVLARTRTVRTLSLSRALSLGAGKYASCGALAGGVAVAAGAALGPIAATFAFVIIFYVVEVQLVFLFPIALDASAPPHHWWRAARASTVRAGGTWRAFWTVLPIAAHMLLGLASMSPRRAWCAGCAAVTIWYEESSGRKSG